MGIYFSGIQGSMQLYATTSGAGVTPVVKSWITIAKVKNFSVQTTMSLLDCTTLGDTDSSYRPGLRSSTGSCECIYYQDTPGNTKQDSGGFFLRNLMKVQVNTLTTPNAPSPTPGQTGPLDDTDLQVSEYVRFNLRLDDGGMTAGNNGRNVIFDAWITSAGYSVVTGEIVTVPVQFQLNGAFREVNV